MRAAMKIGAKSRLLIRSIYRFSADPFTFHDGCAGAPTLRDDTHRAQKKVFDTKLKNWTSLDVTLLP